MEWKQNAFLQVEGVCSRSGVFPAMNPDDPTDLTPTNLSPEFLKNIFSNFSKPVSFRITHSGKDTVGYLTSLGYSEVDDTVHYKGFVYDPDGIQKVSKEGFDKISLEIDDLSGTSDSPTSGKIKAAVFTRKPAVPDTDVQLNYMYFSLGNEEVGDSNMVDEGVKTEAKTNDASHVDISSTVRTEAQKEIQRIKEQERVEQERKRLQELETENASVKQEKDALTKKEQELSEKYKKLISAEVSEVETELRNMGFDSPDEYLKSLELDTRLEALKEVRDRMAKSKKLSSPPNANIKTEGAKTTKDAEFAKLGLPEGYKKYLR